MARSLPERVDVAIAQFAPHEALAAIWDLIAAANKYVVQVRPWELAKHRHQNPQTEVRLATTLYNLAEVLRLVAYFCTPFLPATADRIRLQLGITIQANGGLTKSARWGGYPANTTIQSNGVLFPKLDPLPSID